MLGKVKEFFRVLGEFKQIIPVLRYKFPLPDEAASLAHSSSFSSLLATVE